MKVKVIKAKDYAAALLPDGSVVDAGSEQELRLRLACTGNSLKTSEWKPNGKRRLKEAVLATVSSSDPGALYYAFCAAYLAEGKPALAYAYMKESAGFGMTDFLPGAEISDVLARSSVPYAHRRVQGRFIEKLMSHPLYRKVKEMIGSRIYGAPGADWRDVHRAAAEALKWDGKKDGKGILEAALANPALK